MGSFICLDEFMPESNRTHELAHSEAGNKRGNEIQEILNEVETIKDRIEVIEPFYKMMVVGSVRSGKSAFVKKFVFNEFSDRYQRTYGLDFITKNLDTKNKKSRHRVQIFDMAGNEPRMCTVCIKNASCGLVIVDPTNELLLNEAVQWCILYNNYRNGPIHTARCGSNTFPIGLVFTLKDLLHETDIVNTLDSLHDPLYLDRIISETINNNNNQEFNESKIVNLITTITTCITNSKSNIETLQRIVTCVLKCKIALDHTIIHTLITTNRIKSDSHDVNVTKFILQMLESSISVNKT